MSATVGKATTLQTVSRTLRIRVHHKCMLAEAMARGGQWLQQFLLYWQWKQEHYLDGTASWRGKLLGYRGHRGGGTDAVSCLEAVGREPWVPHQIKWRWQDILPKEGSWMWLWKIMHMQRAVTDRIMEVNPMMERSIEYKREVEAVLLLYKEHHRNRQHTGKRYASQCFFTLRPLLQPPLPPLQLQAPPHLLPSRKPTFPALLTHLQPL